jgi:uncharacterized integral membrane protein (TIGR00698 family)
VAALAIATASRLAARYTGALPDVVIALGAGILLSNAFSLPKTLRPGIAFVLNKVLRAAIVLLGAGLTLASIARLGGATLWLVLLCVCVAVSLGLVLARVARLPGAVGVLIGAGTAICGGTAILAIGPLIEASGEEIAYAVTTIFTFNIIALIVYPPLGRALGLSAVAFGSWAGTAVNDTSIVVATGYVYGPIAGATATIVKLTRTLLLVPLAVALGAAHAARTTGRGAEPLSVAKLLRTVPWFVLGFVGMALMGSLGAFPEPVSHTLTGLASFLIVVVLAAVGLNVDIVKIRTLGLRPLAFGLVLAVIMAGVSLALIRALRIG